ncbi:sugar phosphate nucleotidyltransferase [Flagellimonas halotolerans]|uniref:Sugar phosphate nucleotidyltransferase n=1 Tax=Flagellimonas halotolerans TaxID=3112164 RepID=A0ABU6IT03_9FLAO|nr:MULTISPECIES: sugar phosphate nucleotidyltransferase [unclassified Allomuricauda]MEC3966217.1 sugar phosphate nucleotidyltransferase [Muricauda sp. SYSU M86414]MEC4266097.1 sugar phosphate nucleotidyltransferase [Muricauda sp. SYSU M84420]
MDAISSLVILAGGASSRMKKQASKGEGLSQEDIKQANERSKGLIGVGQEGRPLLDYLLYNAKLAGYAKIYMVIGENGQLFKEFYGGTDSGGSFHGLQIRFVVQHIPKDRIKPLGTADALYQATQQYPELKSERYTVCNSDNLYSEKALRALRETGSPNALIAYDREAMEFSEERISGFALLKLDDLGYVRDILEKPRPEQVDSYRDKSGKLRVSMNAFTFDGATMQPFLQDCPIHPERGEKELPTAFLNMLRNYPGSAVGIPLSEHVPDLTAKDDIVNVKIYLKEHYPDLTW